MLKQRTRVEKRSVVVVDGMGTDGRMTVEDPESKETYEVVDYIDGLLSERLATLSPGRAVRLTLTPVRGEEGWAALRLLPGGSAALGL